MSSPSRSRSRRRTRARRRSRCWPSCCAGSTRSRCRSRSDCSPACRARAASVSATARCTASTPHRRRKPSLTIGDLDRAVTAVQEATGSGSAAGRRELLATLFGRATEAESGFMRRLFTGELRQGASRGADGRRGREGGGRSAASGCGARSCCRAISRATAAIAITERRGGLAEVGLELFRPILPCSPRPRRAWPRRSGAWIARRWSGSSTASVSRFIAAATRSGSTRAT